MQVRTWVCPKLCGCELEITAEWASDLNTDGKMYQHPIPYTINLLNIVNICAEHQPVLLFDLQTDPTGRPGYLKLPIQNPTDAEKLYSFLVRYNGQVHTFSDLCGCKVYECGEAGIDESHVPLKHPIHTKKCQKHVNDTDDHKQFFLDCKTKSLANSLNING